MHDHIQVPLLLGRRTKGNLACCFHSFFAGFRKGLSAENHSSRCEGMANESQLKK